MNGYISFSCKAKCAGNDLHQKKKATHRTSDLTKIRSFGPNTNVGNDINYTNGVYRHLKNAYFKAITDTWDTGVRSNGPGIGMTAKLHRSDLQIKQNQKCSKLQS